MKKVDLKKLVVLGLGGILMTQAQANAAQQNGNYSNNQYYTANESSDSMQSSSKMTENDLLQQLSPENRATYQSLSKEGKDLSLKLANQTCKGMNECKGMNSCKSAENACAGLGGCKGHSKGPFTDKNMAVMVAAKKMAEKRLKTMGNQ